MPDFTLTASAVIGSTPCNFSIRCECAGLLSAITTGNVRKLTFDDLQDADGRSLMRTATPDMTSEAPLADDTAMPFGKHKGTPLDDIPTTYLHWLYHNGEGCQNPVIVAYIEKHWADLKADSPSRIWTKRNKTQPPF